MSPPGISARMKFPNTVLAAGLIGLLSILQSACVNPQSSGSSGTDQLLRLSVGPALSSPLNRSRIALDLVSVLLQVEGASPADMNVDVSRLQGAFGESLKRVLAARGYRTAKEANDLQDVIVQFRARRGNSADVTTVILTAGPVRLKRDYKLSAEGVRPVSLMYILGAPAENIVPDASIFSYSPEAG